MKRTKTALREDAHHEILHSIVDAALAASERDEEDLAEMIREEGTRIAKLFNITHVAGLPKTFPRRALI